MFDAVMGSASEEEEEEEKMEPSSGDEEEEREHDNEEEEEEEEDDEEEEEEDDEEEQEEDEEEEAGGGGFKRERATKTAGSLRVSKKRAEKKRVTNKFVREQREFLKRYKKLPGSIKLQIRNDPNIPHVTKHELLKDGYPYQKCKHPGCTRNANRVASGSKGECNFHGNERRKQDSHKQQQEAKKRLDDALPRCWRCEKKPARIRNNKRGLVSMVGKNGMGIGMGSEAISRGDEMFCAACTTECCKYNPRRKLNRFLREMQCCDCPTLLIVGGKKKELYHEVTHSTFRCKKCYNRVYRQQRKSRKSLSQRLFPLHAGSGSIPSTRKCNECNCTAQDYKGTWHKVRKGKILHAVFQTYRCRKCYDANGRK